MHRDSKLGRDETLVPFGLSLYSKKMNIGANASTILWACETVLPKRQILVLILWQKKLKYNIVVSGVVNSKRVNMRAKVERHSLE